MYNIKVIKRTKCDNVDTFHRPLAGGKKFVTKENILYHLFV